MTLLIPQQPFRPDTVNASLVMCRCSSGSFLKRESSPQAKCSP